MKRIVLTAFVLSLALVAIPILMPEPVCAMTGNGTAVNPYMIYNATDLQNVSNDSTAYYELANDIDASCTYTWNWDAGRGVYEGFVPIFTFTGSFNGNFHAITNLYMNWYNDRCCVGLFHALGTHATVQNVYISGANITNYYTSGSASGCAGVLAGLVYYVYDVTVSQVAVSGNISNTFNDNAETGNIRGEAGGLVGYVYYSGGNITKCVSDVDVEQIGLTESIAYGGGLIGFYQGTGGGYDFTVNNCYARGDISVIVSTSYPVGAVGGLVGYAGYEDVGDCYSTGSPSITAGGTSGGLIGSVVGSCGYITNCFWDTQTSGQGSSACGTGHTTSEMKTQSTFTDAGWDFDTIWDIEGTINGGYPYLTWWYAPYIFPDDFTQVVWFQPNAIIEGTTLPNRAGASYPDGIITWGANPAGITITHGELIPEEEYDFVPIIPDTQDIIKPNPGAMTGDVCVESLRSHPLYPFVQILSIDGFLNERLVWIGLAWFFTILAMFLVHIGPDTHRNSKKPQHFVLTVITGLGLSIMFYTMCIFPLWVPVMMAFGLIPAIIWERQPVI